MTEPARFEDNGEHLEDFMAEILIRCPKCSKCAIFKQDARFRRALFLSKRFASAVPGRIQCPKCGYNTTIRDDRSSELEAYLQTRCCNEILWALNEKHLVFLEAFVTATLRRRKPYEHHSLITNLPSWMKAKKNRQQVAKGLGRLRRMLEECE